MKRTYFLLLFLLLINACSDSGSISGGRKFWVIDTTKDYTSDSTAWHQITAKKRAENNSVIVYVDIDESDITDTMVNNIAEEFETNIYPNLANFIGTPVDVDGNGKIILLIFDIIDGANIDAGDAYVGGYFYAADLYSQSSVTAVYPAVKSNEGEILYIDIYPLVKGVTDINKTIAHEFTHLLIASYNLRNNQYSLNTWIEEGITESASHIVYGELTNRITYFNNNLTLGHSLFAWSGDSNAVLNNYALSYLFMQFMRSQSAGKNYIFKDIIESGYKDYRAITTVLDRDTNLSAWGSTSTERFSRLLLRFYAASTGLITHSLYSYDSEITTALQMELTTLANISLGNGAGVVKTMGGVFASGSAVTDFIYLSVTNNGGTEDFEVADNIDDNDLFIAVYNNYEVNSNNPVSTPLSAINLDFVDLRSNVNSNNNSIRGNVLSGVDLNKPCIRDFRMKNGLFNNSRDLHFQEKIKKINE